MIIAGIVAMTKDGVIGRDNQLPWRLPGDLARFKAITLGCPVIMGRKTWDSIGRPLPGRLNVVITRNAHLLLPDGVVRVSSLSEALDVARRAAAPRAFVIGGGEIFRQAFSTNEITELYVTWVDEPIQGDAHFPLEPLADFEVVHSESHEEPLKHRFVDYKKKGPLPE